MDPQWQAAWQLASRPFMMRTLVALALFFFAASFVQLGYLTWQLSSPPRVSTASLLNDGACVAPTGQPAGELQSCHARQRERAMLLLEANIVERRYHQSNALVMFSVWSRYLGFITGMILAIVGATFILGKLSEPETSAETSGPGWKASIKSTSPGLILCFLGAVLIVASITTLHSLQTEDSATYLLPAPAGDDGSPIAPEAENDPGSDVPIGANEATSDGVPQ